MPSAVRTVRVPDLDLDFDVLADDAIIGPSIERGSWAPEETLLFRRHLTPGCRVVDLGANVGWFAVQAVLAGAEVHAFEPVPDVADVCERNLRRAEQHGPGRGVVHRIAAGAERGRARIELGTTNHGDNRVVEGGASRPEDMGSGEAVEIEVAPVDAFVEGPVRFLKVDTQGSEWFALQGAKQLLAASPQLALLIELWPYALRGATPQQLLEFLAAEGFTLGKATEAPYPMAPARILRQMASRQGVQGGIDLYGVRGGLPFHVTSARNRLRAFVRSLKED
jgi:FkbM family methyltransferase